MKRIVYTKLNLFSLLWLVGIMLAGSLSVHGQTHLKGQRFTQITASRVDRFNGGLRGNNIGYAGEVTFGKYTSNLNAWPITLGYLQKSYQVASPTSPIKIPLEQFYGTFGYQFKWYRSPDRLLFITSTISGLAGYELVNKGKYYLYDSTGLAARSRFVIGADLGFDVEYCNVILGVKQRWNPSSQVQQFHTLLHLGYRFHH